jgi:hypothetical protein
VIVQVNNKRERSLPVRPPGVEKTSRQERQDEVMDGFLVEPQNQGGAGTTWEPSHELRLAEATPSSQGF